MKNSKINRKFLLSLTTILATLAFYGCGDSNNRHSQKMTIEGIVIDEPIENATIEIYDENGTLLEKKEKATNKEGFFSLSINKKIKKYLIHAYNGKINGQDFMGNLYSICFNSQCNVTPITTIVALEFANNIKNISLSDIENFNNKLGIKNYQSINLNEINRIRELIKKKKEDINSLIGKIVIDMKDGYADTNVTLTIFPHAKRRNTKSQIFEVDLSKINNFQKKNLRIVNFITGEKVKIGTPISYSDYYMNIGVIEENNYKLYDNTPINHTELIYMLFSPYSRTKLDINSTVFWYIFNDYKLAKLNEISKSKLVNIIQKKYKPLFEELTNIYNLYLKEGGEKNWMMFQSKLSFFQKIIKKNELSSFGVSSNVTNMSTVGITPTIKAIIKKEVGNEENKNVMRIGPITLIYSHINSSFTIRNLATKYFQFNTFSSYEGWAERYDKFWDIEALKNSIGDKLVKANTGGAIGIGIDSIINRVLSPKIGGTPTSMMCEEFDGNVCDQRNLNVNYSQSYMMYSNLNLSSLQGILNWIDIIEKGVGNLPIVSGKEIKNRILKGIKKIEEKSLAIVKESFERLDAIFKGINYLLDVAEIYITFSKDSSLQNTINISRKIINNIADTIDKLQKIVPNFDPSKEQERVTIKSLADYFHMRIETFLLPPVFSKKEKINLISSALFLYNMGVELPDSEKEASFLYRINGTKWEKFYLSYQMLFLMVKWWKEPDTREEIEDYLDKLIKNGYISIKNSSYRPLLLMEELFTNYYSVTGTNIDIFTQKIKENIKDIHKLISYSNFSSVKEYVIDYIFIPAFYQGLTDIDNNLKEFLTSRLQSTNLALNLLNEVGGKIISFVAFPNRIYFSLKVDNNGKNVYFSDGGITPVAFVKGIEFPKDHNFGMKKAFLKIPTTDKDSYYGLIVTSSIKPARYRPLFKTIFKEPAIVIRKKLDEIDEDVFAKVEWEYKRCNLTAVRGKGKIEETRCQNFNNNYLEYSIKGDDIDGGKGGDLIAGFHDRLIYPYPNKNGDPSVAGSYFDFFDYMALKWSGGDKIWGPSVEKSNFTIINKTPGIYLEKIKGNFFSLVNQKVAPQFSSPEATDVLFKITNAKEFDFDVESDENNLIIKNITLNNPYTSSLTFLIIPKDAWNTFTLPKHYYIVKKVSSETIRIPLLRLANLGKDLYVIAFDHILDLYGTYIGKENPIDVLYSLNLDYSPQGYITQYITPFPFNNVFFNEYAIVDDNEPSDNDYPFMRVRSIHVEPNYPPIISNINISNNKLNTTLFLEVKDENKEDFLQCTVEWGDGSKDTIECNIKTSITHSYPYRNIYHIKVKVTDGKGGIASIDIPNVFNIHSNTQQLLYPGHYKGVYGDNDSLVFIGSDNCIYKDGDKIFCSDVPIIKVIPTQGAFAALKSDGTVVTWGDPDSGGNSSAVQNELYDIEEIIPTSYSFSAIRKDHSLITWAYFLPPIVENVDTIISLSNYVVYGLNNNMVPFYVDGIKIDDVPTQIIGTDEDIGFINEKGCFYFHPGFRMILEGGVRTPTGTPGSGGVRPTGDVVVLNSKNTLEAEDSGDDVDEYFFEKVECNVANVYSTRGAFAMLKNDGTVKVIGAPIWDISDISSELHDIIMIRTAGGNFYALRKDGKIIKWGIGGNKIFSLPQPKDFLNSSPVYSREIGVFHNCNCNNCNKN